MLNVKRKNGVVAAIMFVVASLLFLSVYYFLGMQLAVRSLLFVIPTIICCVFILRYGDNINEIKSIETLPVLQIKSENIRFLYLLNLLLGIINVCLLINNENRTLFNVFIISLMGLILLIQIFQQNINLNLFFIQLFIIQLILAYSVTLKYPFYFGYGDIVPHIRWIELLEYSQPINEYWLGSYAFFPLYHIFFAISSYLGGIPVKSTIFIVSGLLFPFISILGYIISYRITKNIRFSLLFTLFFAFNREIIFHSNYFITRAFAFIFILFILYIIFSKTQICFRILLIIFTLALIITHQTTIIHFLFILLVLSFCLWIFNKTEYKLNNYMILLLIGFLSYWFYLATRFFIRIITKLASETDFIKNTSYNVITKYSESILHPELIFLLNRIDLMILIFLIFLLLSIYFIKKELFYNYNFMILSGAILSLFYFPSPLLLLAQSTHIFLLYRLPLLVSVFITFISALGFAILLKLINPITTKIIICCIIFLLFTFFSISNEQNGVDIPEIAKIFDHAKNYYGSSDMSSYYFIDSHHTNSSIYSDANSHIILSSYFEMNSTVLYVEFFNHNNSVQKIDKNKYILIKTDELNNNHILLSEGSLGFGGVKSKYKNENIDDHKISPNLNYASLIYSNEKIDIYT